MTYRDHDDGNPVKRYVAVVTLGLLLVVVTAVNAGDRTAGRLFGRLVWLMTLFAGAEYAHQPHTVLLWILGGGCWKRCAG